MLGDQGLELADEAAVAAEFEIGFDSQLERRDAGLLESPDLSDRKGLLRLLG